MTIQNINARPSFRGYVSTNVLNIMKDIEEKMPNGNPPEAIKVLDTFQKKLPPMVGIHIMEPDTDPDKIKYSRDIYNKYNADVHGPMANVLYERNKKDYEESIEHQGELYIDVDYNNKIFIEEKVINEDGIIDYDKFLKVFTSLTLKKLQALINTKKEG